MNMRTYQRRSLFFGFLTLILFPAMVHAYSLDGSILTVTYTEPSFGDPDIVQPVTVGSGIEIAATDSTGIGNDIMLDGEFIDIGGTQIVLNLFGGGNPFPGNSAYQTTGLGADAAYIFSGFDFGVPGKIAGVTSSLSNIIGFSPGSELFFTDDSITVMIGTLGILNQTGPDLGTISLDINFAPDTKPPIVPEPATILLIGLGVSGIVVLHRRRRD